MVRLGVFSDLHLTNSHSKFKLNQDGVSDLIIAQDKFIDFFVENTKDCDINLFLGDFTHRETLDPITQTYCNRALRKLLDTGKDTIIIEGNHCLSDKGGVFTVLSAASELSNFSNAHFVIENEMVEIGQIRFYCVPYRREYQEIESYIEIVNSNLNAEYINVLLFHLPAVNALLDNGIPSVKGVNLSKEITSNFNLCLGGDFHTPQQLVNNEHAYYVGAPFSMNMNDQYERGFWKVDIDKDSYSIEKLQNPFNYYMGNINSEQFLELLGSDEDTLSRSIVKIDSEPSQELLDAISENRSKLYKLTVGKKQVKVEKEGVESVEVFSHNKDVEVIEKEVGSLTDNEMIKGVAVKHFESIVIR
jgi:DNA repair exonuclease SbcCD nuclease subunit